jgi:UDP-N-acetylglucosamine 2-epimerase (non-hydrolysing)
MMPKIAVITSSRADYWLLRPLISTLHQSKNFILFLSGEHLEGSSLDKIKKDGFIVNELVECLPKDDSYFEMTKAIARGISNFSNMLKKYTPDIFVLLGDRFEIFAAAISAYTLKIPIAHIHGGEVTHGALDDGFRHAISKLASIHFVSHDEYKKRLTRMGESPDKVYTVGAIGLDNLDKVQFQDSTSFYNKYEFLKNRNYFLLTLHSSTLCSETIENQIEIVIESLNAFKNFDVVITQSNRDPGGLYLNKRWLEWSKQQDNIYFIPVLGDDYLTAAFHANIIIGNSSSGILEIPYLNKPVLNLGNRQDGRIMPQGVYSTDFNALKIKQSIQYILDNYSQSEQIYGKAGSVSKSIYDVLTQLPLDNLIYKKFYDAS